MADARATFGGVVLTGGRSERMGRDKALIRIDGTPMAVRVARALQEAGADIVTCVGGDLDALRSLGLHVIPDDHDDAGPLAGILSALAHDDHTLLLVAPCDVVDPDAAAFVRLVDALTATPDADVAVPRVDGVWRPVPCALRATTRDALSGAFAAGERAVHRAMARLDRVEVDAGRFADADTPEDLRGRR